MMSKLGEIAVHVFVAAVVLASCFFWWRASDECSTKHGVLVKDVMGFPACLPGAK